MDSGPMVKKRFETFKQYLKQNHSQVLSTECPTVAIVTHAGIVSRFFEVKGAQNAKAKLFSLNL